jgi:RNA polymerase sigma-70 factor (ECF subfamily)
MPVTHGRGLAAELPHGLIDACRKGEPNAFRALFELCKDDVYTIALNFTANETVAFDISQDVFVKLFSAIRSLRDASEFRTWLFRLVVNACTDEHRRAKRFVPAQDAPLNAASSTASPEEEVRERQLGLQVRSAVAGLAPRLRTAILLRYVEGFSYAEMARALGCSMGTIASRLSRGHKLLAQRLSHMRGAV